MVQARQANIATVGGNGLCGSPTSAMISGTEFCIEDPVFVAHASRDYWPGVTRFPNWLMIGHNVKRGHLRLDARTACWFSTYDQGRKGLRLFVWLAVPSVTELTTSRRRAAKIARRSGAEQSPSLQGAEAGQGGWDRNGTVAAKTSS